ncbi:MAG: APC family permease [Acidobacteria bacterium]|nr:MAG: APC family permease [Acidobacteriota bacterium]
MSTAIKIPPTRVVVATTAMLSFISFWRAAAIVLADLGSSAFYAGGIAEEAIGLSAPWLILGVMLFSICVRTVYIESSSMFVRGGVYRVVKEAMGGTLAKISVSALIFDFILTAPISGVSAGQYLVGLVNETFRLMGYSYHLDRDHGAAVFAILVILYFWRKNLIGIEESSGKAMSIMKVATVMVVIMIGWGLLTVLVRGSRGLPPLPSTQSFKFSSEALGWLQGTSIPTIPLFILIIGFGHSILALSGEETLAQVYREIAHPKLQNLKRAAITIFIFSATFTPAVSFLAYALIADKERAGYHDNMISGIAMHLLGPYELRLLFQALVVLVGILMLASACNTAIIGSNGVLNRLSEDGVLPDWFRQPHHKYGTTYRLLNCIVVLQILAVIVSRGNVFMLGEAYAFGVIWSFAMNAVSTLILRFKRPEDREWRVPLNFRVGRWEIPVGLSLVALVLIATAIMNLFTKRVATISGIAFTAALYLTFLVTEHVTRSRKLSKNKELERFLLENRSTISADDLNVRPGAILVAVRDYRSLHPFNKVLEKTNVKHQDIVALTVRRIIAVNPGQHPLAADQLFTDYEQLLFTKVVEMAEKSGKKVELIVVPGSDPLAVIMQTALRLKIAKIVAGVSYKMNIDELARRLGEAWEAAGPPEQGMTLELIARDGRSHFFDIGPHPPRLWPEDIDRAHRLWLKLTREKYGARLHHRDVVGVALKRLEKDLESAREKEVLRDFETEVISPAANRPADQSKRVSSHVLRK